MISIKDLSKAYGDNVVYSHFNLDIEEGNVLCILGESGCGKSTLLNILAGLTPCEGDIPKLRTAYVFQEPRLVPNLTVLGNLRLIGADEDAARQMLASVGLDGLASRYPRSLSGGQAQRVALCRAFLFPADLMLLDEPFSSLDLRLKISVMQVFKRLRENKRITALFVTHDVDEALCLADRIVVLGSGGIAGDFSNTPSEKYGGNSPLRERLFALLSGN